MDNKEKNKIFDMVVGKVTTITKDKIIAKMNKKKKFRRNLFARIYDEKILDLKVKEWDFMTDEEKSMTYNKLMGLDEKATEEEQVNANIGAKEEIMYVHTLLKENKLNLAKTFRELKEYGDVKRAAQQNKENEQEEE